MVTDTMDINTDPGCGRAMDSDMAPGCCSNPDYSCGGWHDPWAPTWPHVAAPTSSILMAPLVTGTMGIDSDQGCCRATDPDVTLGSSLGLVDTMSPCDKQASHIRPVLHGLHLFRSILSLYRMWTSLSLPHPTVYLLLWAGVWVHLWPLSFNGAEQACGFPTPTQSTLLQGSFADNGSTFSCWGISYWMYS